MKCRILLIFINFVVVLNGFVMIYLVIWCVVSVGSMFDGVMMMRLILFVVGVLCCLSMGMSFCLCSMFCSMML